MGIASYPLEKFDVPGKGFVIWSGHEFWAYAYYRDNPGIARFVIGTQDIVKAFMLIKKAWE